MHDGLVFWLLFVLVGCLHVCLCCFKVVRSWNDVFVVLSDSVSDPVGDGVGSLYAESVSSVLLFRFCIILVDCFVDFLLSLGVNTGLAKQLAAIMNFVIFL